MDARTTLEQQRFYLKSAIELLEVAEHIGDATNRSTDELHEVITDAQHQMSLVDRDLVILEMTATERERQEQLAADEQRDREIAASAS